MTLGLIYLSGQLPPTNMATQKYIPQQPQTLSRSNPTHLNTITTTHHIKDSQTSNHRNVMLSVSLLECTKLVSCVYSLCFFFFFLHCASTFLLFWDLPFHCGLYIAWSCMFCYCLCATIWISCIFLLKWTRSVIAPNHTFITWHCQAEYEWIYFSIICTSIYTRYLVFMKIP